MSQTSYSTDMAAAKDGQIYDIGFNDFLSGVAEESLVPGVYVKKGTADKQVLLPAAVADVTNPALQRGFVARDVAVEEDSSGNITYLAEDMVSVMTRGRMWVPCEDAFDPTDSVFVRTVTAGSNLQLGRIRTDADTTRATLLPGVKILNSGVAGALALIQFDLV